MDTFLFARFHAHAGQEAALREAIAEVVGPTREESGCVSIDFFESIRDPREFYIHSRWRDLAAFELHAALPHTVRFVATAEPLIDHPFTVSLTRHAG